MIHANYTTIAEQLQDIRDPRQRRGQSYEWPYLLIIVASAVLAGQQSVRGMAQWASEQAPALIASLLPPRQRIPCAATLHRVLIPPLSFVAPICLPSSLLPSSLVPVSVLLVPPFASSGLLRNLPISWRS
jgi:hypothetical protein